ncbi:MAG TPA: tetratricopeptide repeat protein, partial [Planctomycetota bacterium]|nr:tetratricopeptide repeat protein [Planctomycetota bacterium]
MTFAPGRVLGAYRLLREIGRGGQGVVYAAEDARLRRRVAVKVVAKGTGDDAVAGLRFRREAAAAAALQHPHLCPVLDAGESAEAWYLVMPLLEGETLAARYRARRGPDGGGAATPPDRRETTTLVAFFEKAARAVHAAHEAGVIHRDLKPANLLVSRDGEPVVLDFGVARGAVAESTAPEVVATPAYLAPELCADPRRAADRRSDVWALGASLYEGVAGRRPFEGATAAARWRAALTEDAPDPRRFNAAASADLAVVLRAALETSPERRYATALAFADDLRAVLDGRPPSARRAGTLGRLARFVRRRPAHAALAAALVLGVSAVLALSALHAADRPRLVAEAARRRALEVDARVAAGFAALGERLPERARELFEEAAAAGGSDEADVGAVVASLRSKRFSDARAAAGRLAARGRSREAASLLLDDVDRAERGAPLADPSPVPSTPPRTALDAFVRGERLMEAWSTVPPRDRPSIAEAAAEAFEAAALRTPAPRDLFFQRRLFALARTRDLDRTRAAAEILEARRPGDALAAQWIGQALRVAGASREALPWLERAVAAAPNDRLRLLLRAAALVDVDRPADALAVLDGLGDGPEPHLPLFRARALRALGRRDDALAAYEDAVRRFPDDAGVKAEHGGALHGFGRLEEALTTLQDAVRIDPQDANARFNLGVVLHASGRESEAAESYLAAAHLDPSLLSAHVNAAHVLNRLGRFAEGLVRAEAALALAPERGDVHAHRAVSLLAAERFEDALDACDAALAHGDDGAEVHYNRGYALARLKRVDDAVASYRAAAARDPEHLPSRANLARLLFAARRFDEAEGPLEQCVALAPEHVDAVAMLGVLRLRQDRFGEARELLTTAARVRPKDAVVRYNLGLAAEAVDRPSDAEAAFRAALSLDPKRFDALLGLSDVLRRAGRFDEAVGAAEDAAAAGARGPRARVAAALARFRGASDSEKALRDARAIAPDVASAVRELNRFGVDADQEGYGDDAEAAHRLALALDPTSAPSLCNLAARRAEQGRHAEADELGRRGHALGSA